MLFLYPAINDDSRKAELLPALPRALLRLLLPAAAAAATDCNCHYYYLLLTTTQSPLHSLCWRSRESSLKIDGLLSRLQLQLAEAQPIWSPLQLCTVYSVNQKG